MDSGYREKWFEYEIGHCRIEGMVHGRLLPPEHGIDAEVVDFRIDARAYYGEDDEHGVALDQAVMGHMLRKDIEDYAMDVLCGEEP